LALAMRIGYSGASPYQVRADRGVGVFLGLKPQAESYHLRDKVRQTFQGQSFLARCPRNRLHITTTGGVIRNDPAIDLVTQTPLCRGWTFEDEDDDEYEDEYLLFRERLAISRLCRKRAASL
jgi:hypothetical protein